MARTKISEFSATPANNTDIDSINISEGCAPSGINDAIRELMAQLKDFQTGAVGDSFNGPIGTSTAAAGAFTTLSATGAITSTLATGSAPLVIASTTKVANLNVDLLDGADWASPAALGSTTPAAVSATTLSASSTVTLSGGTANGVAYLNGSKVVTSGSALTFDGTNYLSVTGLRIGGSDTTNTIYQATGALALSTGSTSPITFNVNVSEGMRLTSTGLGIGTSSPSQKLVVSNAGAQGFEFDPSTGILQVYNRSTSAYGELRPYGSLIRWFTGTSPTEKMRLDSSGNLGLGVTPSAWGSDYKSLQVGVGGSFNGGTSIYDFIELGANYRSATGDKYLSTTTASKYRQYQGIHSWFTAASGTAGNAITFTQAMSLLATGTLLLGTTQANPYSGFEIAPNSGASFQTIGHATGTGSGSVYMNFNYNQSGCGSITQNGTSAVLYNTSSDYRLKNITGSITTSGAYIDSLNPVEGTWKADGSIFVGLIAHEVQEASRTQVATGTKDGAEMQAMDYSNSELIANLIAEVKSLRQRVATLEAK